MESGETTFEVGLDREEVGGGERELIRFAPGEYQTGYNAGDERAAGWALGAPGARHDWEDLGSIDDCRECGEETGHTTTMTDGGRFRLTCNDCGTSFTL